MLSYCVIEKNSGARCGEGKEVKEVGKGQRGTGKLDLRKKRSSTG